MWIVELVFDPPEAEERLALRPAHRERLKVHHAAGELVMAGPLVSGEGGVMVWDLPDEPSLRAVLAQDPYYDTPSIVEVRLHEWDPIPL